MARGSIVSGWQYQPLKANQRAERDVYLRMIMRAARALAEHQLVRCTDFAFEQRSLIRTPTGRPGIFHEEEAHTLAPDEAWMDVHAEGIYRLELSVQIAQPERGAIPDAVVHAMEVVVSAGMEAHEEEVQRTRRRRRKNVLRREELARVFAAFRRSDVQEMRA
jgi:hypothetical protein